MKETDIPEEKIEKVKEIKEVPKMFENVVKETKKALKNERKLGYKAGEYNNKIETAKQALNLKMNVEVVHQLTGLPIETIKTLKKEMK